MKLRIIKKKYAVEFSVKTLGKRVMRLKISGNYESKRFRGLVNERKDALACLFSIFNKMELIGCLSRIM